MLVDIYVTKGPNKGKALFVESGADIAKVVPQKVLQELGPLSPHMKNENVRPGEKRIAGNSDEILSGIKDKGWHAREWKISVEISTSLPG